MRIGILSVLFLIVSAFTVDVLACGDSLYRVGKGVSYRVYTAPLPGSVLVYGRSEGARQLAEQLARSGHGVRLVSNDLELGAELQSGDYDVVIAAYSDHGAVEQTPLAGTTYIPVAQNAEEEAQAKQSYDRVLIAQEDEIRHYLKAIHKTLKSKT
jgi:hypothetical protein